MKIKHVNQLFFKSKEKIHFSGIGGIGMSGIAEVLANLGFTIQGSDIAENSNIERLKKLGVKIFIGQKAENLKEVSYFVKSTAIKENNPELIYAQENKIPVIKRSEMLAELMRLKISIAVSGTHGKTTTTSLVASIFENAKLNPTVINGGIINNKDTNAYIGTGDFLIAEADESDETFIKIPSTIGVITNIDPEHLDHYKSFDNLKATFQKFIENLPFYGFGVLCIDHPEVRELASKIQNRKIITYSMEDPSADVYVTKITHNGKMESLFDINISDKIEYNTKSIQGLKLPIPGKHNVSNALAAISIALELGFKKEDILCAFDGFHGVKRRFTITGDYKGTKIIDDYAHHPEEIKVTLQTAKDVTKEDNGKVIAIFQPHRYSRTKDLLNDFVKCFENADIVYITDIYAAGEKPIDNISKELLVNAIKQSNNRKKVFSLELNDKNLVEIFKEHSNKNDIVVFMGAGSITNFANNIPNILNN